MDAENSEVQPPFGPPDLPWVAVTPGAELREGSYQCGEHHGKPAYIGRVRHKGEFLIGTAVPSAGVCYIARDGNVSEHKEYEIIAVDCGNPLVFEKTSGSDISRNAVVAGRTKDDDLLYIGRHIKDNDVHVGWVHREEGHLHVNQDGKEKLFKEYDLLVHRFLDRMCICPPCPPGHRPPTAPPLD